MTEVKHGGVRGAVAVCGPETVQTVGSMTRDIAAADLVQIGPSGGIYPIHATAVCPKLSRARTGQPTRTGPSCNIILASLASVLHAVRTPPSCAGIEMFQLCNKFSQCTKDIW